MIWLVCGGRDFSDSARAFAALDRLREQQSEPLDLVIEGGCRPKDAQSPPGADLVASMWAAERGVHFATVPALWGCYGKSAGPKRNGAMLLLRPDLVVAFPGGRGTEDMVRQARAVSVRVVRLVPMELDAIAGRE